MSTPAVPTSKRGGSAARAGAAAAHTNAAASRAATRTRCLDTQAQTRCARRTCDEDGMLRAMAIKLHTCGNTWIHGPHPCWKVMKALQDAGIEYEQVKNPTFPRGRRTDLERISGQQKLPVIEFEDGRVLREESA